MGSWNSLGQELVESYMTGFDEDMEELGKLIQDRIGCSGCEARYLCAEYKDTVYQGECALVLNSFFSDTEEQDTEEQRAKNEEYARELENQDWERR